MNREHEAAIRVNVLVASVEDWRVRTHGLEGSGKQKSSSWDLPSGGVRAKVSPLSSLVPSVQFSSEQTGKRLSSCLPSAAIPHTLSVGIAVSPPEWSDDNINSASPRKNSKMSWNWQKRHCIWMGDHRPLMRSVPDFPERPGRWVRLSTWQFRNKQAQQFTGVT